ncbi:hypothetical protein BDY19DRAFT_994533 [Irpex rosettiformis]|uniref:Uncharacterized protein n=1 Tax=Irpex rosettiformis TaxID=378272 RepID=A0ACB8U196_9APHY|nr:hypothetical protein BDY19DRAFT_994533 [Irpex rosettiformis]
MPEDTLKRRRVSGGDDSGASPKDIQDKEIWMSDGNIIIAAVDKGKSERHLFKCHRGLLASRLPVLREMFDADISSESVTASASEHYEGAPIVRLYDEVKHVRKLLEVLYNPIKLPHKWWLRKTMDDLVGLMRLSKKYEAEDLYQHCVYVFQNAWPATLKEWDHRNKDIMRIWYEEGNRDAYEEYRLAAELEGAIAYVLPDPATENVQSAGATEREVELERKIRGLQAEIQRLTEQNASYEQWLLDLLNREDLALSDAEQQSIAFLGAAFFAVVALSLLHTVVTIFEQVFVSLASAVTPRPDNASINAEIAETATVARLAVKDLQIHVKKFAEHRDAYSRLLDDFVSREVDRIAFERNILECVRGKET